MTDYLELMMMKDDVRVKMTVFSKDVDGDGDGVWCVLVLLRLGWRGKETTRKESRLCTFYEEER